MTLYKTEITGPDEVMVTIVDFVPSIDKVEFTPALKAGLVARDTCGDGTNEYLHNNPLVLWPANQLPIKYYYDKVTLILQKGIDDSFIEINKLYGKTFFERTVNQAEAKVIISIMSIDVPGNTLARAQWFYSLSRKEITRATITFDSNENWSYLDRESCGSTGNIFDIGNVGMHEIGHIVGLAHAPTDKLQTMYASTGPGQTLGRSFGNGDILGFQTAYKIVNPIPENRAPTAQDISVVIEQNQETMIQLKATDPDNDPITYTIIDSRNGRIILSGKDTVFYVPDKDYVGSDSFKYYAQDNNGLQSNTATVLITIKPANKPPIAENLLVETVQNKLVTLILEATDPENEKIRYEIVTEPEHGSLALDLNDTINKNITYIPIKDYSGVDKFTYIAIDEHDNQSNEANVTIIIRAITPKPEPEHKLTDNQLITIKTYRLQYEILHKAGMRDKAAEALEKLQNYIIEALISLHS